MRRSLVAWLIVAMVSLTVGFRPAGALNVIFDDRVDWTGRPNGTVGVLGDSVGYGLVRIGGLTDTLAANSWGPVRSYTLAGLHAAPEGSGDPHNVATWINTYRAQGIVPRVMVVVTGSNDVGWPQGSSVARNQQRIETAMASLGTTEVVWTTITHHNPAYEVAWNQALINAAAKWPNLHLCDWRGDGTGQRRVPLQRPGPSHRQRVPRHARPRDGLRHHLRQPGPLPGRARLRPDRCGRGRRQARRPVAEPRPRHPPERQPAGSG